MRYMYCIVLHVAVRGTVGAPWTEHNPIRYCVQQYIGRVLRVQDGIFFVSTLPGISVGEVVTVYTALRKELYGVVFDTDIALTRIVLLTGEVNELAGNLVLVRTLAVPRTRAGRGVLGHVVGTFGQFFSVDGESAMDFYLLQNCYTRHIPIMQDAPSIIERMPVRCPLYTGLVAVDCFFPIGRGQRQLIIGDQKSGKTTVALTAIINQRRVNAEALRVAPTLLERMEVDIYVTSLLFTPCIYVAIGQRRAEIVRIYRLLEATGALYYTCIVFAASDMGACEQYLAPYAGCAIGEWFREHGYHAVVIQDDLTAHAIAYRQLSLLLRRPPSREAFPADIFFLHARLLERSAQLNFVLSAGSLTTLPLIETQLDDISAYIPTNVISITDGQIFLGRKIANSGRYPAVDFGLSVSRIGTATQTPLYAGIAKRAKVVYALYRRLLTAEKMGGELSSTVQVDLARGNRINVFTTQAQHRTYSVIQQLFGIYFLSGTILDGIPMVYTRFFLSFLLNPELLRTYATLEVRMLFTKGVIAEAASMSLTYTQIEHVFEFIGVRIRGVVLYLLQVFAVNSNMETAFLAFSSL